KCDTEKPTSAILPSSHYRIGTVGHDTQLCLWDLPAELVAVVGKSSSNQLSGLGVHIDLTATTTPLSAMPSCHNRADSTVISIEPLGTRKREAPESVSIVHCVMYM